MFQSFITLRKNRLIFIALFLNIIFLITSIFPNNVKMFGKRGVNLPNVEDFAQTPTLKVTSKVLTFTSKDKQTIEFSLDSNEDMDANDLVINNEEESKFKDYASPNKTLAEDKKKIVFDITPKGKAGSLTLKISYKNAVPASTEVLLTFGYKNVVLKENQSPFSSLLFGEKKTVALITDPADNKLKPEDIDITDDKILKVAEKSKAPGEITFEAVGVGKSSLKSVIKGFTYILPEVVVGPNELTGIFLMETGKSNIKTDVIGTKAKVDISLPERTERTFDLMGNFKVGKPQKLTWLNLPTKSPGNADDINPESTAGSIRLVAKALNDQGNTIPASFSYRLRDNIPPEYTVDSAKLDEIEIKATVIAADSFLELSTPKTGDLLLANGKVNISGVIRKKNGTTVGGEITFELKDEKQSQTWVQLIDEGSSASVIWQNPTPEKIRQNYDIPPTQKELPARPDRIVVIAKATVDGGKNIENRITIRLAEIKKFTQLKVKLNVMDEQTATDLYGSVTAKDYYVLIVRLFNDLKDEQNGQPTGNSIIAYSASMELAIGLEKKYLRSSDSSFPRVIDKKSMAITPLSTPSPSSSPNPVEELESFQEEMVNAQTELNNVVKDATEKMNNYNQKAEKYENQPNDDNYEDAEEARIVANSALNRVEAAWERLFIARENLARRQYILSTSVKPEIGGPDVVINDNRWHPVSRADFSRLVPSVNGIPRFRSFSWSNKISSLPKPEELRRGIEEKPVNSSDEDPPCVGTITYRPLTFEMIVNTVDRRDERSFRSKAFKLLDFIGTGTSFVTAFAVPGPGSDLPLGLEKYSNLLIPGLNKLFPSMKEQNRQNIVSQTMKPIEEIPYGSDITRVIFVPKKPFRGLIRGHETRISEICPFFFKIEVAVIQNASTVQQGVSVP